MAYTNKTIWNYSGQPIHSIQNNSCMMSVRRATRKIDVYIPKTWLSNQMDQSHVERWVNLGSEVFKLFPARLSEEKIHTNIMDSINSHPAFDQFRGLEIEGSNKKSPLSKVVESATLYNIDRLYSNIVRSNDNVRIAFQYRLIKQKGYNSYDALHLQPHWSGYLEEYQLKDTKENLMDHVIKKCREFEASNPETHVDCYKLTLDFGAPSIISAHHKLAILTFYRFLWSPFYRGVVKDTLHLMDCGVDSWIAMYAALNRSDRYHYSYYGFISRPGLVSMDNVIATLRQGMDINTSFSVLDKYAKFYTPIEWSQDDNELVERVNTFANSATQPQLNPDLQFMCVCPSGKLTMDKTYTGQYHEGLIRVVADDWVKRSYIATRFRKIK